MQILSRYDGKKVRITTEDGSVFTGTAEVYPSGYGLHEFDRAEESVLIAGMHVFHSDIREIEILTEEGRAVIDPRQYDDLMGELLEGPYWIVDILPEQVPADADGQYFAVERYYLRPERLRDLRRRYAEILLRLNCYDDMVVSFDSCESWERNPDPETFAGKLTELAGNSFLRAVFPARRAMVELEHDDTWMTVYDPDLRLLDRLRTLAAGEGLFVWSPPGGSAREKEEMR